MKTTKKQKNIFKNFKNKYNKNTLKYKKIIMKKIMILSLILAPNLVSANYLNSANFLSEKWIIVNQSQNPEKYNLEKNILRQEIAWIIAKMSNLEEKTTCENKFEDVKNTANNKWACGRIESLLEAGIIAANKNYNPESFVSKSEALWFILKWLYKEDYEKYIKNNENNSWEENAKNFAKEKWILEEEITNFTEKAKRGFIFSIMEKALKIKELWKEIDKIKNNNQTEINWNKTNNDRISYAKTEARKWLSEVNWKYSNYSELSNAAKSKFWEESDIAGTAMNLTYSWEFRYNYKLTVKDPSRPYYVEDLTKEEISKLSDEELNRDLDHIKYNAAVTGFVNSIRYQWWTYEQTMKAIRQVHWNSKRAQDMINYANSLKW